jgi:hypothetical protein
MPILPGHGKALAIRGGEDAAAPDVTEREVMVIIDERGEGGLEGVLAEVPGGAPG